MKVIKFLVLVAAAIFAFNYFYEDIFGIKELQGEWVMDKKETLREYRRAGLPEVLYQEVRKIVKQGATSTVDGKEVVGESGDLRYEYSYKVISNTGSCYTLEYDPAPLPGFDTADVCIENDRLIVHTPFNGAKEYYVRPY